MATPQNNLWPEIGSRRISEKRWGWPCYGKHGRFVSTLSTRFEPLAPTDPLIFPVPVCHGASFVVFRGRPTTRTFDLDGIYRRVYTRVHGVSANTPYSHWNAKGFENPNKAFFSILLCLRPSFLFPIRHVTKIGRDTGGSDRGTESSAPVHYALFLNTSPEVTRDGVTGDGNASCEKWKKIHLAVKTERKRRINRTEKAEKLRTGWGQKYHVVDVKFLWESRPGVGWLQR